MRPFLILAILVVSPLASLGPRAHAALAGTVAIAVDTAGVAPAVANEVQSGATTHILTGFSQVLAARALANVSLTPVDDAAARERALGCEDIACLRGLAESAGLDLVVRVRVERAPSAKKTRRRAPADYLVSMVAVQPAPNAGGWTESTDCRGCGSSEIKHSASLLASAIAERVGFAPDAEEAPAEAAAAPPHPEPPAAPVAAAARAAAPPPFETRPSLTSRPLPEQPSRYDPTYLSVTALTGGAVLLGAGLFLLHLDGQGTCEVPDSGELCARRYKTRAVGISLTAAGGVAALGGLVGLVFFPADRDKRRVTLDVTPSSVLVSGGF